LWDKGKGEMDKKIIVVLLVGVLFLMGSLVSAFFHKDPQLGPTEGTDVDVTVGNAVPTVVIQSLTPNPVIIASGGSQVVTLVFRASDNNGNGDLDDTTIDLDLDGPTVDNIPGDETDCTLPGAVIDANTLEYTCTLTVQFWNEEGTVVGLDPWTFTARISDSAPAEGTDTFQFDVQQLTSIAIAPATVTYPPTSPGSQFASLADTVVTNDGNVDIADGDLGLTAFDLCDDSGATCTGNTLGADNFYAGDESIVLDACNDGGAVNLADNSARVITSFVLARGPAATRNVEHCLDVPLGTPEDIYSTNPAVGGTTWTFQI